MSKRKSNALEVIPKDKPPVLTLTDEQFNILKDQAQPKPVNPFPWVALMVAFVLMAVVGSTLGVVAILKPTPAPIVYQNTPNTVAVTETPLPTVTKTPTLTPTPTHDIMQDMAVIENYYSLLSLGDMESAWNCLTLKFRRDSFANNFEEFKAHWSRTGPVAVYEIVPEKVEDGKATALVRLYFYNEQRIRYYRFHLQYNPLDKIFQIDSVESTRKW